MRRATAAAAVALLAATGVVTTSTTASAALSRVGTVSPAGDPAEGFPAWYADNNGVALQMCLDGVPNCLAAASELVPAHNAGGDAEAFYFNADAEVGGITVSNALEAAYAGDGPGQEMVFVRSQISAQTGGLVPGAVYSVTDPYGTLRNCTATPAGTIRNNQCRTETVPAALDFNGALGGRIGPFLTWDTYVDPSLGAPPPAGYIGDNVTPHKVLGSPTGFNKVRITGRNINADGSSPCAADWTGDAADCAETDLFVVQGKVQPGPSASLSSNSVAFGNTASSATKSVTYTSTGSVDVTVDSVTATGSADFAVTDTCAGATVAPGSTCHIDVTYNPTSGTSATGAVTVTDSTTGSPRTISLSGSALPDASVTPSSLAFGTQKATTTSAPETVTVANSGVAPMTVASAAVSGPNGGQFRILSNDCAGSIPADGGCEITVAFAPASNGAKTGTLTVNTNGGNRTVALSGQGTTPVVSVTPTAVSFGDQTINTTSPARSVTLTNSGSATVTIDNIGITGADSGQYSLGTNTCTVGANVSPGTSCVAQVSFRPTAGGAKTATLSISADGAITNVPLSGNGVAPADTVAPSTPTGVRATASGTTGINLTWTASTDNVGVAGYRVFRDGSTTALATVTTTSYADTGLAPGSTHSYRVAAFDGASPANVSGLSVAASATTGTPVTPPGAPTIGVPTAGNASATVRWTAPASNGGAAITGYSVRTFVGSATTPINTTPVGAVTSTVISGLTNGTAYTFDVAAVNSAGTGGFSGRSAAVTPQQSDITPPTLTARSPAVGATVVSRTGNVTATFSEGVTGVSATTFTLKNPAGASVAGTTVAYNATTRVATLNPGGATATNLAADTTYTVALTSGIRDAAGNTLAPVTWSFTTGPRPTVTARTPAVGATGVRRNINVTATFSENMTGWSATNVTMDRLSATGTVVGTVTGTVTYNPTTRVGTFNPFGTAATLLAASTQYRVNLGTGLQDTAGNPLAATTWTFTTGTA